MKNYYQILGLEADASWNDIREAYRGLAKKYHPDRSGNPETAPLFIEATEAYQFLSDSQRRDSYRRVLRNESRVKSQNQRREEIYKQWVRTQQRRANHEATTYASRSYDEFTESKIYKTAMITSKVYNYIFIATGIMMVLYPLYKYFTFDPNSDEDQLTLSGLLLPMIIGLAFTYGIYYFLFKLKED